MAFHLDAATLQAALAGYKQQLDEIEQKMAELRRRLGKPSSGGSALRSVSPAAPTKRRGRKHRMSAEGRARIAAAQRARWAKTKRAAKKAE
jgi:hypothetical protein